jgi:hypothetical protein
MPPPTISLYYRAALDEAAKVIESTPDDRVIGMDPSEWKTYLIAKYGLSEIVLDSSRDVALQEDVQEYRQRGYDIATDRGPGALVRETVFRLEIPVIPSDTLPEIWNHKVAPNTYSLSYPYPAFGYEPHSGLFTHVVKCDEASVNAGVEFVRSVVNQEEGRRQFCRADCAKGERDHQARTAAAVEAADSPSPRTGQVRRDLGPYR